MHIRQHAAIVGRIDSRERKDRSDFSKAIIPDP